MTINPLAIHEHFKCDRSAFEGLEHYYKPVEAKAAPQLDWNDLADEEYNERYKKD